jgi:hypothetical protein
LGECTGACTLDQAGADPWAWQSRCTDKLVGCGYVVFMTFSPGQEGDNRYFDPASGKLVAVVHVKGGALYPTYSCAAGPAEGFSFTPCDLGQDDASYALEPQSVCDPCDGGGGGPWCDAGAPVPDAGAGATDATVDAASD